MAPSTEMRIAISSPSRLVREGLASILKEQSGAEIVAMASTPQECLKKASKRPPDAIVVDRSGADRKDLDYVLGLQLYQRFGLVLVARPGDDVAGFTNVIS